MIGCSLYFLLQFWSFSHHLPSVSGYLVFYWTSQISRQMLIIILYISSVFTSVRSMSQLVLVSINTCPTDVIEEFQVPGARVAFLNLVVWFLFYYFYVCFNLNYCILFSLIDVSVMIICRVSWSLLVRKSSSMLFFLLGFSIYCCKHCSCANCRKAFAWTWF